MSKKMRITVISLLSVVFAVSVGFLVKDYCDSKMQAELYDNLIETVEDTDDTEDTMSYSEDKNFLPDYQELYMQMLKLILEQNQIRMNLKMIVENLKVL